MIYLFVGQDQVSKDDRLEKIKRDLFPQKLDSFNFDLIYAPELKLSVLQETLLRLPVEAKKRLVFIKQALRLREPIKKFLLEFIKKSNPRVVLILDLETLPKKDTFFRAILRSAKKLQFKEEIAADTFMLSRQIDNKRADASLKILQELILTGTRPEKIMGGLRYTFENSNLNAKEKKRRLALLLKCDIGIKTGKLKAQLALERLLLSLCCS